MSHDYFNLQECTFLHAVTWSSLWRHFGLVYKTWSLELDMGSGFYAAVH